MPIDTPCILLSDLLGGKVNRKTLEKMAKDSPSGHIAVTVPQPDGRLDKTVFYLSGANPCRGSFKDAEVAAGKKDIAQAYPGLQRDRLKMDDSQGEAERAMARAWMEENRKCERTPAPLTNLLCGEVSLRDKKVAATVIQWLSMNNGWCFLFEVIKSNPRLRERFELAAREIK